MNQFFQKKTALIFQFNSAVANDERKNEIIDKIREYLEVEHETKSPKKRVLSKTAFFLCAAPSAATNEFLRLRFILIEVPRKVSSRFRSL